MDLKAVYQGKKIFVTGHTGFKGAWLAAWLQMLGAEIKG
ncbi:MAG: CDP-glucose 4,6-dehydratase, partial [Chitinophagaceae bacterium]